MQRIALCRSRRELSNAYLLAKFGFDTAENEPCQICPIEPSRNAKPPPYSGRLRGGRWAPRTSTTSKYVEGRPRKSSSIPRPAAVTPRHLARCLVFAGRSHSDLLNHPSSKAKYSPGCPRSRDSNDPSRVGRARAPRARSHRRMAQLLPEAAATAVQLWWLKPPPYSSCCQMGGEGDPLFAERL